MVRNFAFSNYVPSSSCLDVHVQGVLHSVQLCSTFHWQSAMQCCLVYMVKLSRESACHSLLRLLLSLEASWHTVTDLPAPKIALQTRCCSLSSIHGLHQLRHCHSSGGISWSVIA